MNRLHLFLFGLIVMWVQFGCINKDGLKQKESQATEEEFDKIEILHAKGFRVSYFEGGKFLEVLHPKSGEVLDQIVLISSEKAVLPDSLKSKKSVKISLQKVASQSTTHVSYFDRIHVLDKLYAVGFADFVRNENAKKLIDENKIKNLTTGSQMNKELLIDIQPDLFFMYPFDQQSIEQIKEHVKTILTTEYLEENPLAKAQWIKFFALFFNEEGYATEVFNQIVNEYDAIKLQDTNHEYFMNLPFNGIWDCPPANSYSVSLMRDAGLGYEFQEAKQDENLAKTVEEMLDRCLDTEYWIIIAQRNTGFSMEELKSENYLYSEFAAVQKNNVIVCNTAISDYFGDALLEPQIVLKNLIEVVQNEKDSTEYFYRLK